MITQVKLPSGELVPALGQGMWRIGEDPRQKAVETAAIRLGLDLGLTLIDTAEMYGDGESEALVGAAIAGRRQDVFLTSKVYPHNATREGVVAACERSLRRLKTDRLDLYLLHWRGQHRLEQTIRGFEDLQRAGKIRYWGVSNFDVADMEDLVAAGGKACAANQILYNLRRRGPEWDLIGWLAERNTPIMAYSPIEQGRLPNSGAIAEIARARSASRFQVALAWLLQRPGVIVIPKAATQAHVRENRAAADLRLAPEDLAASMRNFGPRADRNLSRCCELRPLGTSRHHRFAW
jgi:diketogulonate reductase-like aldo/keto reductase